MVIDALTIVGFVFFFMYKLLLMISTKCSGGMLR